MSESDTPKPGVLVALCECGPIISELVDLDVVGQAAAAIPGVETVIRHTTLCSTEGQAWLAEQMKQHPHLRLAIGACSPREHADTFADVCEVAGQNPYLISRANIREQCAWVTPDKAQATEKAIALVAAAAARAREQESLEALEVTCETGALVIGAGIAGMSAAVMLGNAGRQVTLIDREPSIGGRVALLGELYPGMECAPCMLEPLMDQVLHHNNIEVLTGTELYEVVGYLGNYAVTLRTRARHVDVEACYGCGTCTGACPVQVDDERNAGLSTRAAVGIPYAGALPNASVVDELHCLHFTGEGTCEACVAACPFGCIDLAQTDQTVERQFGAIVIATGSEVRVDTSEHSPFNHPRVLTAWALERMLNPDGPTEGELRLPDGSTPKSIALVHCADETGHAPGTTCSRTCCQAMAKYVEQIGHMHPDTRIYEFGWDRALGGPRYAHRESSERPTSYAEVHFGPNDTVAVVADTGRDRVRIEYARGDVRKALPVDLAVVATPMGGARGIDELAGLLGVALDADGFVRSEHSRLRSHASRIEGVYMAGCAAGQKDTSASASQAAAAAGAVLSTLVPGTKLVRDPAVAVVNPELCGACRTCVAACPYSAITFDEEAGAAVVNELLCRGCGTCVAGCPSSAITARHFTDVQITTELQALLKARS